MKAVLWFTIISCFSQILVHHCQADQKSSFDDHWDSDNNTYQALEDFYWATGGPNWTQQCDFPQNKSNCWLDRSISFCNWYQIYCAPQNQTFGIFLSSNNLQGSIPDSFSTLQRITDIGLSGNSLTGPFPKGFTELPLLNSLVLDENNFYGHIPANIGDLTDLGELGVRGNNFSGPIPPEIGKLQKLEILRMNNNNRVNQQLNQRSSGFTGPIPPEIGNLTNLLELDLSSNSLNGTIPETLGNLSLLTYLILAMNNLEGPIPNSIGFSHGRLPHLSKLILSHNQLSGPIPAGIDELTGLVTMDLSFNQLTGELPLALYNLRIISGIDLSYNNFTGSISESLEYLAISNSLSFFSVEGNLLMVADNDGAIPSWLTPDSSSGTVSDGRIYYCLGVHLTTGGLLEVHVSPEYFLYRTCYCAGGYHGIPPNNCNPCPENCLCTEGGTTLTWPRGYYPIQQVIGNQTQVVASELCPDANLGNAKDSECNPCTNCTYVYGENVHNLKCQLCSQGSEDRFCSRCICDGPDCYFRDGSRCVQCESVDEFMEFMLPFLSAFLFTVLVSSCAILFIRRRHSKTFLYFSNTWKFKAKSITFSSTSGYLKILLIYLQTINSLTTYWPSWVMRRIAKWLNITNVQTQGMGLSCLFPSLNIPVNALLLDLLIPIAMILLVMLFSLVRWIVSEKIMKRDKDHESLLPAEFVPRPWHVFGYLSLSVLYLLYFNIANNVLGVFNCTSYEIQYGGVMYTTNNYMQSLPWLECSMNSQWRYLMIAGITGLIIYVVGIPVLFAGLLLRFRGSADTPSVRYWLGKPLYKCYRPASFWFELVMIARRLSLACALSLIPSTNPYQSPGVVLILILALALQFYIQPFAQKAQNQLEEIAILSLLITYACQQSAIYAPPESLSQLVLVIFALTLNGLVTLLMIVGLVASILRALLPNKELSLFSSLK